MAIEAADMVGIKRQRIYAMDGGADSKLTSIAELSKREFGSFDFEHLDPASSILLPFSSGTTGIPKVRLCAGGRSFVL